ncbi:MAG: hypothetical protein GXO31_07750 [Epsilonproteobacteria bacterium]|nr:hypothetical protein [Campylobacterota bacterium]
MKTITLLLSLLLFSGCAVKYETAVNIKNGKIYPTRISDKERKKIDKLYSMLISLDPKIDRYEAKELAKTAVLYPIYLSKKYDLVYPPNFHNFLVNINLRQKGLCYQWVEDLMKEIGCKNFKSFSFHWGVANRGKLNEHNVIVVTAKNASYESGIVFDAWRNSGDLYFNYLKNEKKYKFKEWKEKSKIISSCFSFIK